MTKELLALYRREFEAYWPKIRGRLAKEVRGDDDALQTGLTWAWINYLAMRPGAPSAAVASYRAVNAVIAWRQCWKPLEGRPRPVVGDPVDPADLVEIVQPGPDLGWTMADLPDDLRGVAWRLASGEPVDSVTESDYGLRAVRRLIAILGAEKLRATTARLGIMASNKEILAARKGVAR